MMSYDSLLLYNLLLLLFFRLIYSASFNNANVHYDRFLLHSVRWSCTDKG